MKGESITFLGAFILGLAHTIEPCEDKAVVSLIAMWAGERIKSAIALVILYGLSMCLINALFGSAAALIGISLFEQYSLTLKVIAGVITILFGLFMLSGRRAHTFSPLGQTYLGEGKLEGLTLWSVFLMGIGRGLPFCPFELLALSWAAASGSVLRGALIVFIFGLGTTLGLIPLGLALGGLGAMASRTKYGIWVPKITALLMIALGAFLTFSAWI